MQSSLKDIGNTVYGVITSPHFPINNVVVANQITAHARNNVWLLTRPLNAFGTITDGGTFPLTDMHSLKTELPSFRKPGLEVLSCQKKLKKYRYRKQACLIEATWDDKESEKYIGKISEQELCIRLKEHYSDFWRVYNIGMNFEIEIKTENSAKKISFHNKADYIILDLENNYITKVRGVSKGGKNTENHPPIQFLRALLNEEWGNCIPENRIYITYSHVSIHEHNRKRQKESNYSYSPGEFAPHEKKFTLGLAKFHVDNRTEHARVQRFKREKQDLCDRSPEIQNDIRKYSKAGVAVVKGNTKRGRKTRSKSKD